MILIFFIFFSAIAGVAAAVAVDSSRCCCYCFVSVLISFLSFRCEYQLSQPIKRKASNENPFMLWRTPKAHTIPWHRDAMEKWEVNFNRAACISNKQITHTHTHSWAHLTNVIALFCYPKRSDSCRWRKTENYNHNNNNNDKKNWILLIFVFAIENSLSSHERNRVCFKNVKYNGLAHLALFLSKKKPQFTCSQNGFFPSERSVLQLITFKSFGLKWADKRTSLSLSHSTEIIIWSAKCLETSHFPPEGNRILFQFLFFSSRSLSLSSMSQKRKTTKL